MSYICHEETCPALCVCDPWEHEDCVHGQKPIRVDVATGRPLDSAGSHACACDGAAHLLWLNVELTREREAREKAEAISATCTEAIASAGEHEARAVAALAAAQARLADCTETRDGHISHIEALQILDNWLESVPMCSGLGTAAETILRSLQPLAPQEEGGK